ncbi:uncharacterized protein LOC126405952 isoform X2 [Epinephelus moara]|uniref:uncharacterized protein LOC126405952 isoform X2 n=1 Tax=Epinephelus moara TaxID=300413 RepID=UPI00214EC0C1|nr:uncharacterized protein LOC126405952 isoform X2 [Epinephelus moara]XP_049925968.1 uncharacterized protein LOC126405952 isoform X2 [Epinephelus moara]
METSDFVQNKLTEWGFSEFVQKFEDEGIDKETFLSLGDSAGINALIPKVGPRVKFKKRLKEYLQWNSMETCDFVRDKLTEWNLSELIQRFEDEGIDKDTFLCLEESGTLNDLIPKTGPRVKFRKRLKEYLETLKRKLAYTPEMMDTKTDTNSDQEDSPELDPTIFPWHFESTSTSDTDRDNEMSGEPMPNSNSSTGLLAVILFILRHHLTTAVADLMALLNFLCPNLAVASKYPSDKTPVLSIVFYCPRCQNYMGKNPDGTSCLKCGTMFNKKSSTKNGDFFLFASLKDLLKNILKNHGTELLPKTVNQEDGIKDVMDGRMYQNLLKQGTLAADDLTLSWNCDGVPIYNSDTYSLWPLQFTINELPYTQRKENVIVAGLWFGKGNPEMNTFLKPFVDECSDLAQNPFQWSDSNDTVHFSKVFSLVCSSDAVARPLLRNCKRFNGEYGCDWCLHPGMMVKKGSGSMRSYPYDEEKQEARSDEMFKDNAMQAEDSDPKNGVKGFSLLSELPLFDIVFGFVPEYLHSVLLGVSKQLVFLWLDPVNSMKPWYVGQQIAQIDSRLLSLKPALGKKNRSPRPLKCRDTWKASEWRAFLLFYAISVLPGIVQPTFLEHYFYLSFSVHILLQESISQRDLQVAHESLVRFVKDMKVLYGEENVSFNCHQLIHLKESVLNWGPLWATSAFSFERNNRYLREVLNGIGNDPQQICQGFLLWQLIPRHLSSLVFSRQSDFSELLAKLTPVKDGNGSDKPLGKSRHLDLTGSIKLPIEELLKRPVLVRSVEAYDSYSNGHTVYQSTNGNQSDKTDCVIKLKNGCYGEIRLILLIKENCVCTSNCQCQACPIIVVHLYDIKPDTIFSDMHPNNASKTIFVRVERTGQQKAFFLEDIRCKCEYVDGWLVPVPNTYERY